MNSENNRNVADEIADIVERVKLLPESDSSFSGQEILGICNELRGIARSLKKLSGDDDFQERQELAEDLRRCYRELRWDGGFEPTLSERIDDYLEDTLMPLLQDHIHHTLEEIYTTGLSDAQLQATRRRIVKELRSEYEQPIRAAVAAESEEIRDKIRKEFLEEIRDELRRELRPLIAEEIRDELMKRLIQ